MPDPENIYRKLPGLGRISSAISRLYLARDHLLVVNSSGFHRGLQTILFFRTSRRSSSASPSRARCGIGCWGHSPCRVWPLRLRCSPSRRKAICRGHFLGSLRDPVRVPCLINHPPRPTSRLHIRTAVQTERLAALDRLRTARKVLNRINRSSLTCRGLLAARTSARMHDIANGRVPYDPLLRRHRLPAPVHQIISS